VFVQGLTPVSGSKQQQDARPLMEIDVVELLVVLKVLEKDTTDFFDTVWKTLPEHL
jgi:hypothetical protein